MIQIHHTVYENTKRKINSFAYFNKTYNNSRPLDIGAFVLKINFLHVHFADKFRFIIINKICDITYEIVNQDGYTSHIHRNHLVPYYPKEPTIFPFINQINKKPRKPPQKINLIFMITITILTPEDTPMTDTISAHNHKKVINFSSVKRT